MNDITAKIKELRSDLGFSQEQFARALGVTKTKIQNIEAGKQRVDHELLMAMAVHFTIDLNELLGNDPKNTVSATEKMAPSNNGDFIPIPRLDVEASAGHGSLVQSEESTGSYAFNRKWLARRGLNPKDLAVISVAGDSMEPDLHDGDLILINRADQVLRDGRIFAVRYSDQLFVKGVQIFPGKRIFLNSRNSNYAPIIIDQDGTDDVEIIGRVVASMHEW